jgi:tRNA(Ile)-lysidine synthase
MLPRHPLRDRFLTRLDEHLRRDLAVPAGARLRVAFSGGVDSTAALAGLAALAPVRGYAVEAAHVHHGLQAHADRWVEAAQDTADSLGVPLQVLHWTGAVAPGESEEAAARRGRYGLLEATLAAGDWLVTAHQADDQAETVLLYLARGAGLDGLSGIQRLRPLGAGWLLRPLLPFRRGELAAFVDRCGLQPVSDPSNSEPRLARARVRGRLLPCLSEAMGEEVGGAAARSADLLQDAREVVEAAVAARLAGLWQPGPPPALDAAGLAALAAGEGRLVLREALRRAGQTPPARDRLEQARQLAGRHEAAGCLAWRGGGVQRRGGLLILSGTELAAGRPG